MNTNEREAAPQPSRNDRDEARLQVLVIEDDKPVRDSILAFVRKEGFRAEAVADGASGLAVVELKSPEVVILDLAMPVMDGFEFMERLVRQVGRGRPKVIVLSGRERLSLAQARLDAEAYLQKPLDPERMRAALQRLVLPARALAK